MVTSKLLVPFFFHIKEKSVLKYAGENTAKISRSMVVTLMPAIVSLDTHNYSRRQKNGDVSVPFRSVQTETDTVSVQLKMENGVQ